MMLPRLGRRAAAPAGQFARGRHIRVDGRLIVYLVTAMGLNIKYDETCQLACELTRLTGDTMTGAITIALRERLEQSVESGERKKRLRDMRAIANAVFAYWSLAPRDQARPRSLRRPGPPSFDRRSSARNPRCVSAISERLPRAVRNWRHLRLQVLCKT